MGSWTRTPDRVIEPINSKTRKSREKLISAVLVALPVFGLFWPTQPFLFVPATPTMQVVQHVAGWLGEVLIKNVPSQPSTTSEPSPVGS